MLHSFSLFLHSNFPCPCFRDFQALEGSLVQLDFKALRYTKGWIHTSWFTMGKGEEGKKEKWIAWVVLEAKSIAVQSCLPWHKTNNMLCRTANISMAHGSYSSCVHSDVGFGWAQGQWWSSGRASELSSLATYFVANHHARVIAVHQTFTGCMFTRVHPDCLEDEETQDFRESQWGSR